MKKVDCELTIPNNMNKYISLYIKQQIVFMLRSANSLPARLLTIKCSQSERRIMRCLLAF